MLMLVTLIVRRRRCSSLNSFTQNSMVLYSLYNKLWSQIWSKNCLSLHYPSCILLSRYSSASGYTRKHFWIQRHRAWCLYSPLFVYSVWIYRSMCIQTILTEQTLYPGGAQTLPGHRVTRASILTTAQAVAGLPIGPLWTSWREGRDTWGEQCHLSTCSWLK